MKISKIKMEVAMSNNLMGTLELAKNTGIRAETIARIKNGKQQAKPITVGKIAKALNCKAEDLIEMDTAISKN